jgi:hypothetical protein
VIPFFGQYPFEVSKVVIFELLTLILIGLNITEKSEIRIPWIRWAPLAGLVSLSVVHLVSKPPLDYVWGNPVRLQGVLLLWFLAIFSYVCSSIRSNTWGRLPGVGLIVLFLSAIFIRSVDSPRWVGTLGEPNALALASVILLLLTLFSTEKLIVRVISVLVSVSMVVFSGSRSGLVTLGLIGLYGLFRIKLKYSIKKTILLLLIPAVLSLILPFVYRESTYQDRSLIWTTAWYAGGQNWLAGTGWGSIETGMARGAQILGNALRFQPVDDAHNIFLNYYLQGGIAGVACFIWLLGNAFRGICSTGDEMSILLLIAILTMLSFNPASVSSLAVLWFLIGRGMGNVTHKG